MTPEQPYIDNYREDSKSNIEKVFGDKYQDTRESLEKTYKAFSTPKERIAEIIKEISLFLSNIDKTILPEEKMARILRSLDACETISDKDQFLDAVMTALVPILIIRKTHAREFSTAQGKAMNEAGNFTSVNELMSYNIENETLHMHAPHGEGIDNKTSLYLSGIKKLAEIIKADSNIKRIMATSPLVASHVSLFERIGFKVEDLPPEDKAHEQFRNGVEIKRATISREDFLKKILK